MLLMVSFYDERYGAQVVQLFLIVFVLISANLLADEDYIEEIPRQHAPEGWENPWPDS